MTRKTATMTRMNKRVADMTIATLVVPEGDTSV